MLENILKVLTPIVVLVPVLYPVYCWAAGRRLPLIGYELCLFMSATYLVMVILEASIGLLHTRWFGWKLWEYHIMPNHQGYGTYLAPLMWPFYGLHLYWLKFSMSRFHGYKRPEVRGLLTAVEGPGFEFLGNGIILLLYGEFLFYYFPDDLFHLTTVRVMPHYAVAGLFLAYVLDAVERAPRSWGIPISFYTLGFGVTLLG